ncbi:MAG: hypothetical protein IJU52_06465 [Clostridia bacterium]|nr:hypothetical protein [Clostridia bacterium]
MERTTLKSMKFGKEKLKTFWSYYYKQIIAAALIAAVVTVMLVQCVTNKKAAVQIYFAGPVFFSADAQTKICEAFEVVTAESVKMISTVYGKDPVAGMTDKEKEQYVIDYTGEKETLDEFKTRMRLPDTVICLLSRECFEMALRDTGTLRKLEGVDGALLTGDGYGVVFSALDFSGSNSILKTFPEDCVLCLKAPSVMRSDGEDALQVDAFYKIVNFKTKNR